MLPGPIGGVNRGLLCKHQSQTGTITQNQRRYIQAREETQHTTLKGMFAGGDIVAGRATVILAMGAGRRAAKSIPEYLTTESDTARAGSDDNSRPNDWRVGQASLYSCRRHD